MGEHQFQGFPNNFLGIEHAALVHVAVKIQADHHRDIEHQQHRAGIS